MRKEHIQTLELLPWYVNDTLSGKEAETVLKHLADCKECQIERDRLYELQRLVQESGTPAMGHELSLRRVLKRIDASERNKESMDEVNIPQRRRSLLPMGIAASILSLVVAGGAWLGLEQAKVGDEYQTLSSDVPTQGMSHRIELGFSNPIPAATMRQALIETNSNIVSGPNEHGNYLVEVVIPGDMTANEYLARIQQIDGVERASYASN
jgi:hypothetical protein